MQRVVIDGFAGTVVSPVARERTKPRTRGLTMVIDKGLGPHATRDMLHLGGRYIDFLKLGFGTALLYTKKELLDKIRLARDHDVLIYPGGTLLELACIQGSSRAFIERTANLGFTALEVSEGTVALTSDQRERLIRQGLDSGLVVITEVGKKDPKHRFDVQEAADRVQRDLELGARFVIVEGRDSGRGVGIYDDEGRPREHVVNDLLRQVRDPNRIMWEAPRPEQQQMLLKLLGPDANFGNVQPADVLTLEATRQALRGDTLRLHVPISDGARS